jgi:hypothetical protein
MFFNDFKTIDNGCLIVLNDNILLKFINIIDHDNLSFIIYRIQLNKAFNYISNSINSSNDNTYDKIIIKSDNDRFFNSIKIYNDFIKLN